MDVRATLQLVFQTNPQLRRFLITNARTTGTVLGGGAYGIVEELNINGVICAGKKIHFALIDPDNAPDGVENITRKYLEECQLMSDLRHPNVVQFLGVCFLPNTTLPVLVMERLASSLHDLLEDNPNIPLSVKGSILADVARGLVYLHNCSPPVIHRDLSAKNVLLSTSMVAKIGDLGNARIANLQQAQTLSRVPGTLIYMPPQAIHGIPTYGPELDIFSFGHLSLFTIIQVFPDQLLSPNYPDPDHAERLRGRTEVERRERYFRILYQQLGEPHPLVRLTQRCLHNTPTRRPPAGELLQQLEGITSQIDDQYERFNKLEAMRMLREKDAMIQDLQQQISGQEIEMTLLHAAVATNEIEIELKDTEIARLQQQITDQDRMLETVQAELETKVTQLQEKDAENLRLQEQVSGQEEMTMSLRAELEARITQIRQMEADMQRNEDEMHMSMSKLKKLLQECEERGEASIQEQTHEHKQAVKTLQEQIYAVTKERDFLQKQTQRMRFDPAQAKICEEFYDDAFHSFEALMTLPAGLFKLLEDELGDFKGKQLLCELFQNTYDTTKSEVHRCMTNTLQRLHEVDLTERQEQSHLISCAYDVLLNASGLKAAEKKRAICDNISETVYSKFKANALVGDFLEKKHLIQAVEVAWKFVTFPNPVIVCQPRYYDNKIHNKEFGCWDESSDVQLMYLQPVVYRCWNGVLLSKGIIANCAAH